MFLVVVIALLHQTVLIAYINRQQKGSNHYQVVKVEEDTLSSKDFNRSLRQNEESFLVGGYVMKEGQTVLAKGIQRESTVPVAALTFSSEHLIPATATLNAKDLAGCLVDEETMYQLFGTGQVRGQWLTYEDRDYQVRGLIKTEQALVVIQNQDDAAMISSLVLDNKKELYRNQFYRTECNAYSTLDEGYYTTDYNSFSNWISLPNQWSDFAFFKSLAKQIRERGEHMLYGNKDAIEAIYYRAYRYRTNGEKRLVLLLLVLGGMLFIRRKRRREEIL